MLNGKWIMKLISEYMGSARALSRKLCAAFTQNDLLSGRRSNAIPRTGVTSDGLEFSFHGIGCWLSDGKQSVDIDFTPNGHIGAFDAWKLHVFSRENPSIVGSRSQQEVQAALDHLLDRGHIQHIEGSALYRLRANSLTEDGDAGG